jgi:hypothetical protein
MKRKGLPKVIYEDIHIPKNTAVGIYIAGFAFLMGFAFVWEIIWLAVVSAIGMIVVFIIRGFDEHSEYTLPAAEVKKIEEANAKKRLSTEKNKHPFDEPEIGLLELFQIIIAFFQDIIKNKRWQKW